MRTGRSRSEKAEALADADIVLLSGASEIHEIPDDWQRPRNSAATYQAMERSVTHKEKGANTMRLIVSIVILLCSTSALAQYQRPTDQQIEYGPDGNVRSRISTDSQGSRTFYDARGRIVGRTSTDSQGTTVIYDANGNRVGTVTGKPCPRQAGASNAAC